MGRQINTKRAELVRRPSEAMRAWGGGGGGGGRVAEWVKWLKRRERGREG